MDGLRVVDARTLERIAEVGVSVDQWRFLDDRLALAAVEGELQVWDVERLEAVETLPVALPPFGGFEMDEDGRTLAFATRREVRVFRVHYDR